jgi:hypothetical protein
MVGSVFLFEQTTALVPDLFRALPDSEYIADQPGRVAGLFAQSPFAADQTAA